MEEALLENVAAEKVSLSKIASGPCIHHRSFTGHLSRHLNVYPPRYFTFTVQYSFV